MKIVEQPPETSQLDPANPTMKCRTFVKKSVAASVMTFLFVSCDKVRRDIGSQGHRNEERQSGPGSVGGSGQDPRKKVDPDSGSVNGTNVADNVRIEGEISDLLGLRQLSPENLTRLRLLLLQMADSDPEKLLDWCHRKYPQSLFVDRKVAIDSGCLPGIAAMWIQKDPEAAFEALGKLNSNELTLLFEAPLTRDYLLQEKYVRKTIRMFDGTVLTGSLAKQHERVMVALAGASTRDALNELSGMAESPYRSSLVRDVFSTIAGAGDMDQAMAEADKLGDQDRAQALRGVVAKISEDHFEKALEVASHAATAIQQDIYREIARTSAYQNPANAVRILEDPTFAEKIGTDFRQQMLNATATTWAKQDMSAAQQWVEKLPETDAAKGYQGLMTTWMKSDPVAASGWLSSRPLGPARDAGARVLISQIKDTDPEMAEQWRKTLPRETRNK